MDSTFGSPMKRLEKDGWMSRNGRGFSDDHRVRLLTQASAGTATAFMKLSQSRIQKIYDDMCRREAALIAEIAKSGSLALMLDVERHNQKTDLVHYAKTPNEKANVESGIKDFESGLRHYETLTKKPDKYREEDLGYVARDRDKRLNVPTDGMRKALGSQITRLQNRLALTSSDDEKVMVSARVGLLKAINKEYSRLQVEVLHGDVREKG